jgi:hypothetical protein
LTPPTSQSLVTKLSKKLVLCKSFHGIINEFFVRLDGQYGRRLCTKMPL